MSQTSIPQIYIPRVHTSYTWQDMKAVFDELLGEGCVKRVDIVKIHSAEITKKGDIDYESIVKLCDDFNGAQVKAICVEAGMLALRREASTIKHEDFMEAIAVVAAKKKGSLDYYS